MKNLSIEELEELLCSTGYLPPRTEEELLFFNHLYEDYIPHFPARHVDVEAIVAGTCCVVEETRFEYHIPESTELLAADIFYQEYSMAARNFDKLPKDVLKKMKSQHKFNKHEDE